MNPVSVSCCIILKEGKFLITQKTSGLWEFPGGKTEPGENILQCAEREALEETSLQVTAETALSAYLLELPEKTYNLIPVVCSWKEGELRLTEHVSSKWVTLEEAREVEWSTADHFILQAYEEFTEVAQ